VKNQVQLITYADRLGGTLPGLLELIQGPFAGLFGGVHLLPFFDPIDGADAGFDPIDHTAVDQRLGDWSDVRAIAGETDVMADLIVNHISSRSPQFTDFRTNGSRSEFAGLFLTYDSVFPQGATADDLLAIYRPRPALPFTPLTLADGSRRLFWTTFTADQIDIDVTHSSGRDYLNRILAAFADGGVASIRLDAIGYAIKQAGSSCFMMPATFAFIEDLADRAGQLGLEVLVEVHSYYQRQIEIARRVDWVYDFALPPLVLHALFNRTARALKRWIAIRPENAVTVLDTHDGIGVIDIGPDADDRERFPGLVPDQELDALVEQIHTNSRGESRRATGAAAANLDLYQVNCTFYDALGRDDQRYLLSRAIQFFLPGVPQVYYVGLLAGSNDMALLNRTHVGRDINRHYYTRNEIERELKRPVVERLLDLIRLRNTHPAFAGSFSLVESADCVLDLLWQNGADSAQLTIDLEAGTQRLEYTDADAGGPKEFPLDFPARPAAQRDSVPEPAPLRSGRLP
jgi:sucrose phosphorylase